MNMELYWNLGDLWTAREKKAGQGYTYHDRLRNRSGYGPPNTHDRLSFILSQTHAALVQVWSAYHFSSWPPETVRRLEKELADWKSHCAVYCPQSLKEQVGTKILEAALADFQSVLTEERT